MEVIHNFHNNCDNYVSWQKTNNEQNGILNFNENSTHSMYASNCKESNTTIITTTEPRPTGDGSTVVRLEFLSNWQDIILVILFCILIIVTIIGNTLVILAVITTRRLRTVTNCFVMSLAVADWLVGIFVMPPAVAVHLMGTWQLGRILCDIWISLDVLLCTASILSLCAISIDRYLAVTQPLNYSRRRRSKRLALVMILIVWILALAITCPPILGWYDAGRRNLLECRYNQNEGYVVFSAMGSFFIPMAVMMYVYARISCVVATRHDQMADSEVHQKPNRKRDTDADCEHDADISEQDQNKVTTINMSSMNPHDGRNSLDGYYESDNQDGHYEAPARKCHSASGSGNGNHQFHKSASNQRLMTHIVNKKMSKQGELTSTKSINQKSLSSRILTLKRENKTTQTLSIVCGSFIAFWLPFFIYYLITPFLPDNKKSPVLAEVLTWLGWINSAINPFIYAFYSVDFRAAFWRLTLKRFFRNSQKNQFASHTMSIRR